MSEWLLGIFEGYKENIKQKKHYGSIKRGKKKQTKEVDAQINRNDYKSSGSE